MNDLFPGLFRRRRFFRLLSTSILFLIIGGMVPAAEAQNAAADSPKVLRIGFQKYGTLVILKGQGSLEKRLATRGGNQGVSVKWVEFPYGPPLLEAINVGSIDVGTVGESPPVFAQAAGAELVYIGHEPPSPASEALIVPKGSSVRTVADLKGKKIAVAKGSNANYLLVRLLEQAGLKLSDVQVIFLAPADARAAFESSWIDAWAIWDPFLAAAEHHLQARILADGKGAVDNHQFYLSSRKFAEQHPDIIHILLEEIAKIDQWGQKNPHAVAQFLAPQIGIEQPVLEIATQRLSYGIQPVTQEILKRQQKVADTFFALKLLPKPVKVADWYWDTTWH